MKTCIVNFSGRLNGNCQQISNFIASNLLTNNEIFLFNMSDIKLNQCGNCNYECFDVRESCPHYKDDIWNIYETMSTCDAAYFILPNYCDYPCANFFIFSERRQGFFSGSTSLTKHYSDMAKKFIVISNTERMSFREVFRSQDEYLKEAYILFLRTVDYDCTSTDGNLINFEEVRNSILKYIEYKIP